MQLHLDTLGRIAPTYPAEFFRVESWSIGKRIADFTTRTEAEAFAISDARASGTRYDHKVVAMRISRA